MSKGKNSRVKLFAYAGTSKGGFVSDFLFKLLPAQLDQLASEAAGFRQ
jgi:hypothetical protein